MINIAALLAMGLLASFGSYFLKRATEKGLAFRKLLFSPFLYVGGIFYVGSAVANLYLLKVLPYSLVIPLGALSYLWTLIISWRFLSERVTKGKIMGVVLILLGVFFVALGEC